VFVFNHQSYVDVLVLLKLIRRDLSGVAKIELKHHPVVGPVFRMGGVAFIDRGDRVQSVAALHDVVGRLQEGISLAIAPEGTRSPTSRVQPFKKGAFRVAMEGGVPIVPIVIRNAGDVLPRGAHVLRPATLDVAVLEPVSVAAWTVADLDRHVAEVHQRYVDTLRSWPTGGTRSSPAAATPASRGARRAPERGPGGPAGDAVHRNGAARRPSDDASGAAPQGTNGRSGRRPRPRGDAVDGTTAP
jgi:1-acyl-sn-glycerol-3-phosphate acyltransferase